MDPYEPTNERAYKNRAHAMTHEPTPIPAMVQYWTRYLDLYGTPHDANARHLAAAFRRLAAVLEPAL